MNTLVIARNTMGDALRKRVLLVFLLIAVVMLFLSLALAYFSAREQLVTFKSVAFVVILIFGALISISTSIFLIPAEIEKRTIYSVLSKPVQRWEFFLGKFLGGAFTVFITVFLMMLVMGVVVFMISARPPTAATDVLPGAQGTAVDASDWFARGLRELSLVLRGCSVIYFELVLLTAIATTLSLFLTPTVNFSLTALLFIVGSFQDVLAAWTRRYDVLVTKWLATAFYYITPHFQDFNIMSYLVHPEVPIKVSPTVYTIQVSAYGVVYAALVLLIGVLVFDQKEV
jgi:hypothetical protein